MYLKFLIATLIILLYNVQPISNDERLLTAIQFLQQNNDGSTSLDPCRIDHNKDWLLSYYNNYQHTKNNFYQHLHRLPSSSSSSSSCSQSTQQFTFLMHIPNLFQQYFYHTHDCIKIWSSANLELIQAITKVIILVILKIFIKYYVRSYIQFYIKNITINDIIDLLSKATTIAIAKIAIKRALYPALRTAMKTMLIAGLKTLIKSWMKKIKNQNKLNIDSVLDKIIRFSLTIQIKTIIKTIALHILWLVFEKNKNDQINNLPGLMFRVAVIITVKMAAKRTCKMAKKKKDKMNLEKLENNSNPSSPPVDQILLFAIQKLVTKLIKIPLIKIMFD
ncbi:uncharacterized protein LOC142645924 isoform X1 [Dermatophagoides pteronyssinus]|uniref:uncharacterized protein LOC142645924 isoform X1 n=1 Tax=Dermatophagoides pteronyssinus TaxID=6956 RepID=UPI003F670E23